MSRPNYITPAPVFGEEPFEEWPPRVGKCPACGTETRYAGESYGRHLYICEESDCIHSHGNWQKDGLIYSHSPSLWSRCPGTISRDFKDNLAPIIFSCEDKSLIHVIGRCSSCRKLFSGLYSEEATAGFVFSTTENVGCGKLSNNPTYTTRLTCDKCLSKQALESCK